MITYKKLIIGSLEYKGGMYEFQLGANLEDELLFHSGVEVEDAEEKAEVMEYIRGEIYGNEN